MSGNAWTKYRRVRDEYLAGRCCARCASTDNYLMVCWDKGPGPFQTSRLWAMDPEKRQRYLADCVVLCRSCKNSRDCPKRNEHGGGATGVFRCTCIPCLERRRAYGRESHRKQRMRGKT